MGGYVGRDPSEGQALQFKVTYSAAENQTVFAATYKPGYCDVYQNGLKLQPGVDFSALNGINVVLTVPATLGDTIEIDASSTSSPYDFYTKAQTNALVGNFYGVATGNGDTLSVTLTPAPLAWVDGLELKVRMPAANTSTNPTLAVTGLTGVKTIYTDGGQALIAGVFGAGQEVTLRYNLTNDRLELIAGGLVYGATPTQFDASKKLATTEFLNIKGMQASGVSYYSTDTILTTSNIGGGVYAYGVSSITFTLPLLSTVPVGGRIEIWNAIPLSITVQRQSTDGINMGHYSLTSVLIGPRDNLVFEYNGIAWHIIGGSAMLPYSSLFGTSQATNGYQKLPGGMIIQWGNAATNASGHAAVSFPVSFVASCYHVVASVGNGALTNIVLATGNYTTSGVSLYACSGSNGAASGAVYIGWIAIGR